jgi:hypothetical protein
LALEFAFPETAIRVLTVGMVLKLTNNISLLCIFVILAHHLLYRVSVEDAGGMPYQRYGF